MSKDKALKLALDALSKSDDFLFDWHENESDNEADAYATARHLNEKAITALREALAEQPAQQESVAKVCHDLDGHIGWNPNLRQLPDEGTALYTSPPTLSLAQRPHECSRSHPHENMNAMCELRTEIARLTNENARLKALHQGDEINTYRMTLLCIRDGLQQGMSKSIQKLQAREINDVLGLPSFASYRTSPPAQQEPVAWMAYTKDGQSVYVTDNPTAIQADQRALPLYTYPQPAQQEPVAMWDGKYQIEFGNLSAYKHGEHSWIPLYTSPPAQRTWVGLTDEEIKNLCLSVGAEPIEVRMIEAKLKEKNT